MQQNDSRRYSISSPTIAYLVREAEGDVVVLLHGVGSSASTWNELIPHLGSEFVIVAPDYRGHGFSESPVVPYSLDDFVDDYFRLLDELSIETAHIVGFSIGAVIAEAIVLARPERVRSLVLLNTIGGRTSIERERAFARLEVIRSSDPAEVARASASRWFTPDFIERQPALVASEVAIVSATSPEPYAAAYQVLATTDLIDLVGSIAVPVLIVTGENDVGSTPRMSRAVHERVARSQLVVIDGLQHYLHIEAANLIADLINGFLRGPHPRTTTQ
ncbi:MAG: hypothetical protein JWN09_1919 [Microbacteriaceae bacterium]|jgi:pimeloyl-ACP methyl ester carboxylesterase|nr:hypothetical protein [Microbacteriaceae bacterium]